MQLATYSQKFTRITSTASGLAASCLLIPHGGAAIVVEAPDWNSSKALTLYGGYDPNDAASFKPLLGSDNSQLENITQSGALSIANGGFFLSFGLTNPGTGASVVLCEPSRSFAP